MLKMFCNESMLTAKTLLNEIQSTSRNIFCIIDKSLATQALTLDIQSNVVFITEGTLENFTNLSLISKKIYLNVKSKAFLGVYAGLVTQVHNLKTIFRIEEGGLDSIFSQLKI